MRLTSAFRHDGLCFEKIKSLPLSQKCVWRTTIDKKKVYGGRDRPKAQPRTKIYIEQPGNTPTKHLTQLRLSPPPSDKVSLYPLLGRSTRYC